MNAASDRRGERSEPLVAVVGAGAAGCLAAIFAGRAGVRVALLESHPKPGAKIRVSGGGRCNVLPSEAELDDFHTSGSKNAMRNVLYSWPLADVRRFFEQDLGIALKQEATGKVFPRSDSSKEVVDALLGACARAGAVLRSGARVVNVDRVAGCYRLRMESGEELEATRVVVATGGLSLPKTGSDGFGYEIARKFGHTIRPTSPALVPLRSASGGWGDLAGIALPVTARVTATGRTIETRRGDFLFTHAGFSGPVILDVSGRFTESSGKGGPRGLEVAWGEAAGRWDEILRAGGRNSVATTLRGILPRRLADRLVDRASVLGEASLATLGRTNRGRLVGELEHCTLSVDGNAGFAKAEVTQGGLPLEEVHLDSLESRRSPGLYFAGEIFDVTGRVGGFNFLWAWVTGRKAGLASAGDER